MHTVLTGATGLLGGNLAIELLRRGHTVRATKRATSKISHLSDFDIEWVEATLGDTESLSGAFDGADVVFHCAAQVSVRANVTPQLQATNVDGTQHVLDAMRASGAGRLVHCSSTAAIGVSEDGAPCDEDSPFNMVEHGLGDGYVLTKKASEDLVRAADDLDAVVVNPTFMFGPHDAKPSSGSLIVDVAARKTPGYTDGGNNFVDVRDVARGMVRAAQDGRRGERYILGGLNLSYRDIFGRIAAAAGTRPPDIRLPRWAATVAGWAGDLGELITGNEGLINSNTIRWGYCSTFMFSSDKAQRELGYEISPLDDAIRDAIAWFRERGMMPPA
jgi:dihydroflavonol-4-reductase